MNSPLKTRFCCNIQLQYRALPCSSFVQQLDVSNLMGSMIQPPFLRAQAILDPPQLLTGQDSYGHISL